MYLWLWISNPHCYHLHLRRIIQLKIAACLRWIFCVGIAGVRGTIKPGLVLACFHSAHGAQQCRWYSYSVLSCQTVKVPEGKLGGCWSPFRFFSLVIIYFICFYLLGWPNGSTRNLLPTTRHSPQQFSARTMLSGFPVRPPLSFLRAPERFCENA